MTRLGGPAARPLAVRVRKGVVYRLLWGIARAASLLLFGLRVRGEERLPRGGVLLVANHASYLDIPLLGASLGRHVSFVARHSLADNPLLAWVMARCGAVLVRRDSPDRAALEEMLAHLEAGDCVAIFPEGRRSRDGRLGSFKGGAALVARRGGVPVVPVALFGTARAWPPGRLPRPARIGVRFGEPLDPGPDVLDRARAELERLLALGRP